MEQTWQRCTRVFKRIVQLKGLTRFLFAPPMKTQVNDLIRKGESFRFDKNSISKGDDRYTKASSEMLRWIGKVDRFISTRYREGSLPYQHYKQFDIQYLNGYPEWYFNQQLGILIKALRACEDQPARPMPSNSMLNFIRVFF